MFSVRDWFCKRHVLAIWIVMKDSSLKHLTQSHLDILHGSSSPIIFFHRRKKSQRIIILIYFTPFVYGTFVCIYSIECKIYDFLVYTDWASRPISVSAVFVAPQGLTAPSSEVRQPSVSARSRKKKSKDSSPAWSRWLCVIKTFLGNSLQAWNAKQGCLKILILVFSSQNSTTGVGLWRRISCKRSLKK